MNRLKLLSPDFLIGKTLVLARSLVESVWLVLKQRNRQALHFARVLLVLKPRFTMVTNHNLIGLYSVVTTVNRLNLPGALVECGVWNGGSAAVMSLGDVEQARPSSLRAVWLFDSFEGLPRPSERDEEQIRAAYFEGWNQGSIANVRRAYKLLGLSTDNLQIMPGWFSDTLALAAIDCIAVLHIDADWYDSVKTVLTSLYDKVVVGGFVVLDDYGQWSGCNQAVADFLAERGLEGLELVRTDRVGACFRKPYATDREA